MEGRIVNISSQGMFWICDVRFHPGEQLQCWISIPGSGFRPDAGARLWCSLEVVWTAELAGGFGVGCRFEEYVLSPLPAAPGVMPRGRALRFPQDA